MTISQRDYLHGLMLSQIDNCSLFDAYIITCLNYYGTVLIEMFSSGKYSIRCDVQYGYIHSLERGWGLIIRTTNNWRSIK